MTELDEKISEIVERFHDWQTKIQVKQAIYLGIRAFAEQAIAELDKRGIASIIGTDRRTARQIVSDAIKSLPNGL